jgi:ABC-type transport system involved in cytochrome bd biosynthesis fused ATPase/permease subunit
VWAEHTAGRADCPFVFCALAAFEALAPVTGAFQHLGQVIASALRITQIAEQEPEVSSAGQTAVPAQVALTLKTSLCYDKQAQNALEGINLSVNAGQRIAILGRTGCGKSTLLQLLTRAWDPQHGTDSFNNTAGDFSEQPCARPSASYRSACICLAPRCAITCCWPRQRPLMMRFAPCWNRLGCISCLKMTD